MKYLKTILLLPIFSLSFTGCALYHHYGPYYGKVVDAETREPLEGAAVLAVYYTQSYGPAGSISHYLDAQETVTDKNGEFKIPSLNSFTFRPLQSFEPYTWFTIFKPGYGCYPNHKNVKPMFLPNGSLPAKQSVTIELPKLQNKQERIESQRCEPVLIPKKKYATFLRIINVERQDLNLKPIPVK